MSEIKQKAIARYVPMMGWMAQIENTNELQLLIIKTPHKTLKEGMEIHGKEVDKFFEII